MISHIQQHPPSFLSPSRPSCHVWRTACLEVDRPSGAFLEADPPLFRRMTDPQQQRERASNTDAASAAALEALVGRSSCVAFVTLATVRDRASGCGPTTLDALLEAAGNSNRTPQAWTAKAPCNFLSKPVPSEFLDFLLGLAVKHDMLDCIRELLKLGANTEAVDEIGLTPLLIATRAGNTAAISILIEAVGSLGLFVTSRRDQILEYFCTSLLLLPRVRTKSAHRRILKNDPVIFFWHIELKLLL